MNPRWRKLPDENSDDSGRWLLTYSDMITLLLVFFIVLYTLSRVDLERFESTATSIRMIFGSELSIDKSKGELIFSGGLSNSGTPLVIFDRFTQPVIKDIEYIDVQYPTEEEDMEDPEDKYDSMSDAGPELSGIARDLDEKIGKKEMSEFIDVLFENNNLVLRIKTEGVLFDSGSALLKKEILPLLDIIADSLQFYRGLILVEGHTDNLPINTVAYPSNWELSSARASSVLRYWVENNMILTQDIAAAGYADTRPIESNDTAAGRGQNRRVEILVMNRDYAQRLHK